ncbi:MAG: winged helix DNA-binding domain-containing protein [Motilibacteraceae bacterium]
MVAARAVTAHEVALLRLVAQRIAGPPLPDAAAAVRLLGAVQGQDYAGALSSVALRTQERSCAAVEAALDRGEIVRSWPMRGTLHLVAAEDLGWLVRLCAGRVDAAAGKRHAQLGLGAADLERAGALAGAALEGGRRLSRAQLLAAFDAGGVATTGQRGYHLLGHLARTRVLCLGPTGGGQQLFVLAREWIRAPRELGSEQALAELAPRFFLGHGPAMVADLARWSGLTLTAVRAGVAAVRDQLAAVTLDGVEHLLDPAVPDLLAPARRQARGVFLLPGFDELVLGYADRSSVLDPAVADRIAPGGNGVFRPTVVQDGRVVGTWRRVGRGRPSGVEVEQFGEPSDELVLAVEALAAAFP